MSDELGEGLLFPVAQVAPRHKPGTAEASLRASLDAAFADGRLIREVDGPLAEAALIGARALDTADRIGDLKGGYLTAQALPAYQKTLHALRLPAELATPTAEPPATNSQQDTPEWLRDAFGTPE